VLVRRFAPALDYTRRR